MDDFKDWCLYANFDLEGARLIYAQGKLPSLVLFHCHEAAEKALKALWLKHQMEIKKTHDLGFLFDHVLVREPWLQEFKAGLYDLNDYFRKSRYPAGDRCTQNDAMQCMLITEAFFKQFQALHP